MAIQSSRLCCNFAAVVQHMWEDENGTDREIQQGEGGEQGDPLTPALFALGQHDALCAVQESLHPSEILRAFLDDLHVVSVPEWSRKFGFGDTVRLQDVLGSGGGAQRCPVAQHRPSRCPSWNAEGFGRRLCLAPLMSSGKTGSTCEGICFSGVFSHVTSFQHRGCYLSVSRKNS